MDASHDPRSLRVGLVGVGNCASSFVQGLRHYRDARGNQPVPGLMHAEIGGYGVADVHVVAAFDVSAAKVGQDVAAAILAAPNNTMRFADVPETGVRVQRGPTLDGLGRYLSGEIFESDAAAVDVAGVLRQTRTDILVSYLPVGSQAATEFYAGQALEAGCAFVNCIPVFIASDRAWRRRFEERGLPLIGDDIKSQVGATIVHRMLANLFRERGVRLDRTYQLNFGGNADFKNMLERERLESKKISKTRAVTSQMEMEPQPDDIHVGPSDFVPWLTDRKVAYIRLEGTAFGDVPLSIEVKLEVWDSPNSAGVVIDAVRCAKLALDRRIGGALVGPSSYFMKSPPEQFTDAEARARTLRFITGEASVATTVYLVRHAAHDLVGSVLCGRQAGIVLGEEGLRQAAALGAQFRRLEPGAICSSPRERARQTASAIAGACGLEVMVDLRLDEIDFGAWTGASFAALDADPRWHAWNAARAEACPPGGEPMRQVGARMASWLREVPARYPEGRVVAVSHADVIKAAVFGVLGLSMDAHQAVQLDPARVTAMVLWPGGGKVVCLNAGVLP